MGVLSDLFRFEAIGDRYIAALGGVVH